MSYLPMHGTSGFHLDPEVASTLGTAEHAQYVAAAPFPHIVIDDFLPDAVLRQFIDQFPNRPNPKSESYDRVQERLKTSFNPDFLPPELRSAFATFNARPFTRFVENLTGIDKLIPDPYFVGGGLHETKNGGHLSVHADFNYHKQLNLERRVNVLIYLNEDWPESYGGDLELWNQPMTHVVERIAPIANRCVVFNTTSDSFHGHPEPVTCPDDRSRRSIALYYYTATWSDALAKRTTQFQVRPNTDDRPDRRVRMIELARDLLPPLLVRKLRRANPQ